MRWKPACDPMDEAGLGRAAQDWMRREHGVARQLREQFSAYEALLSRLCYPGRTLAGWLSRPSCAGAAGLPVRRRP